MATSTINITLPEELKSYVQARVEYGAFGTPTEYVRELILNDRDRRISELEERLLENMRIEPIEVSEEEWESEDLIEILRTKLEKAA
jgi:antitoxin ParD1/3/4